jgi:hypothetical protein
MLHRAARPLCLSLILATGPFLPSAAARAGAPIAPRQHFVGLVNGRHADAEVYVACGGPGGGDRTTHPLQSQTLAVARARSGGGFTGDAASRVVARFLDDTSVGVLLTTYGATAPVPTTITVPCEGKGVVRFAPRPSSSTSTPDFVAVTYVNLGA